jgi:hypothetical protein
MSGSTRKKLVNTSRPLPPTLVVLCRINCYVLYGIGVRAKIFGVA